MSQYYLVVYCKDGTMHLWPGKDYDACYNKLKKMMNNDKTSPKIKASTIIKRDTSNYREGFMFGKKEILK